MNNFEIRQIAEVEKQVELTLPPFTSIAIPISYTKKTDLVKTKSVFLIGS